MMQKKECVFHPCESVGHSLHRPRTFSSAAAAGGCLLQAIDEVDCITSADGAAGSSCRGRWRLRVNRLSHLTSFTSAHAQWDDWECARAIITTHGRGVGEKKVSEFQIIQLC